MADDACRTAQTKYNALVQSWEKKQAEAAALNEKLQAAKSCDWENGDEFDEALEQSDERFQDLNQLIRTYIQAKEAETTAAQELQKAKRRDRGSLPPEKRRNGRVLPRENGGNG